MDNPQFNWLNEIIKEAQADAEKKSSDNKSTNRIDPETEKVISRVVHDLLKLHVEKGNGVKSIVSIVMSLVGSVAMNKVLEGEIKPCEMRWVIKAMVFDIMDGLTDYTPVTLNAMVCALDEKINEHRKKDD